jgi:hypothetical protein
MSTDIKLTADLGGNKAGDTITVTDGAATYLIDNEYAEPAETKAKRGRPKATDASTSGEVGGAPSTEGDQTAG